MEGYKGAERRNSTTFFNLASLRGCTSIADCDLDKISHTSTDTAAAASTSETNSETSTAYVTQRGLREIPAGAFSDSTGSAPALNSKSDKQRFSKPNHQMVKKQWSIVRDAPTMTGAIVTSLPANSHVLVTNQVGEWSEVAQPLNSNR